MTILESVSSVAQSCPTLCDPMDCSPPDSFHPWNFPGNNTGVGCHFLLQGNLPNPGIKLASPALAGRFFTTEPREAHTQTYSSVSSVAQSCPTLCDPMNRSTPGLPVHHQLPEFTQTHVHRVSDAIQPSHPLSSPSPPAPNPSQHQSLFQ